MKQGTPVYAAVAPAFVGSSETELSTEKLRAANEDSPVVEVAVGADLCNTMDFLEHVPEKIIMATSCCPAWSMMAKQTGVYISQPDGFDRST